MAEVVLETRRLARRRIGPGDSMLGRAIASIGAPHVVALTSGSDEPSWPLMEKPGMERRKDLDFGDPDYPLQDNPTIQYRLTAAQWEPAN